MIVLFLVVSHGISLKKSQEGGQPITKCRNLRKYSVTDIIQQITLGPPLRGSDNLTAILEVKLYDIVEYLWLPRNLTGLGVMFLD